MKYFLDLGGNDSCSARIWRKLYDPKCEYQIYSFEPEPEFEHNYDDIPNCVHLPVGVWIEDGLMHFYTDKRDKRRAGGTLSIQKVLSNKKRYNQITIHTIDFSQWLHLSFSNDDEIVVKMDIEGAEYKVIPKMKKDGSLKMIDKLFIEWHWYKMKGMTEEDHLKVVEMVSHIPQDKWPGVEHAEQILGKNY